jgi:hypothetical protein
MPRWMRWMVILGVALDLAIGGYLIAEQQQIDANHAKVDCYARVFDRALDPVHPLPRSVLLAQARACRSMS